MVKPLHLFGVSLLERNGWLQLRVPETFRQNTAQFARTEMPPPLDRKRNTGPPPFTTPASRLRSRLVFSVAISIPEASTFPPLVEASRRKAADLSTTTLTLPPDVLSEHSSFNGPLIAARMLPPLVCARNELITDSTLMLPPEVERSAGPATRPTDIFPPDVFSSTTSRASSSEMFPPEVRASTEPPILPSLMAPPDVRKSALPLR